MIKSQLIHSTCYSISLMCSRESIMGYESTRRLRESISRHSKPDVAELDDYHRDSLLDKLSGIKSHDFEEAMNWKVPKLKG